MAQVPLEAPSGWHVWLLRLLLDFQENAHRVSIRHAIMVVIQELRGSIAANFPAVAARIARVSDWVYAWILKLTTPSLPFDPKRPILNHYWLVFFTGLALGYLFSFGANWFGSWLSGTLDGPASETVEYFWTDRKNLKIYTIWAPLYCALSFTILLLAAKDLHGLQEFADKLSPSEPSTVDASRLPFSMSVLFWLPLVATILDYIAVINTDYTKHKIYWYIVEVGNNKFKLNAAGYLHFASNYLKLSLLVAAVLFYISFCIEIMRVVSAGFKLKEVDDEDRQRYSQFMRIGERLFCNAVLLAIVISCHHVIWREQVSGSNAFNVAFAHVGLILAILFMVEAPRYYMIWAWRQDNYVFKQDHIKLHRSLYAMKFSVVFFAARIVLYIFIWSFYFEKQLGYSLFSDAMHYLKEKALFVERFAAFLLDRPPPY